MAKADRKFRRRLPTTAASITATIPVAQRLIQAPEDPSARKRFAFIMPCMSRLDHVKKSVPALLANPIIDGIHNFFVFVDHYCPEQSGKWVAREYSPRATVLEMASFAPVKETPQFNKPSALNAGALHAINLGAQYLVFVDADTLVKPELIAYLTHHVTLGHFYIFTPTHDTQLMDLTGFLAVHKRHFVRVNGYDADFKGWGAEDLDMRVRLFLYGATSLYEPRGSIKDPHRNTLRWNEIPHILASSIPHSDDRRVTHYEHKDKDHSHEINLNLLCSNIFHKLGYHPNELHETPLGPSIRRLLGMELFNPVRE